MADESAAQSVRGAGGSDCEDHARIRPGDGTDEEVSAPGSNMKRDLVGIFDAPIAIDFKRGAECRWRVPTYQGVCDGVRPPDELVVKTRYLIARSRLRKALRQGRRVIRAVADDMPSNQYTVIREEDGVFILTKAKRGG